MIRTRDQNEQTIIDCFFDTPERYDRITKSLLDQALLHSKFIFAEFLYDRGIRSGLKYDDSTLKRILEHCIDNTDFLLKAVRDHQKLMWLYAFANLVDTDEYSDTFFLVLKALSPLQKVSTRDPDEYIVPVDILCNLIAHRRMYIATLLIKSGLVIPNTACIHSVHAVRSGVPNMMYYAILYDIFKARNTRKWPGDETLRGLRDTFHRFHAEARKRRTLQEIAVLQCAKKCVEYTLPHNVSWHLRQDLYTIMKYHRKISQVT